MNKQELPQKIKDIETQIFSIKNQFFDVNEEIKKIEIPSRVSINGEIDQKTGKLKFTNDTTRADELYLRLQAHREYQDLMSRRKKLLGDEDLLDIELKFYENTLKVVLDEQNTR